MTEKQDILNSLFNSKLGSPRSIILPRALFVHKSAIQNIQHQLQHINNFDNVAKFEIFEYPLLKDGQYYDMCVVYVTPKSCKKDLPPTPWDPNPTLFINLESFNILEQFIENQNLQSDILKIEEHKIESNFDEVFKVVTFNQSVNASVIISQYNNYLLNVEGSNRLQYFYVSDGFPWLQPVKMQHFDISILNQTHSVLPIVLCHLDRSKIPLNIFDLVSLRLAMCDVRDPYSSSRVQYEIDFTIRRNLNKIVKDDGHLDLYQYAIEQNYEPDDCLAKCFVYLFQDYFKTITAGLYAFEFCGLREQHFFDILRLEHKSDVLEHVKRASNVEFHIEGEHFDRMTLSLFINLVECCNVTDIALDTNYPWLNDVADFNKTTCNRNGDIVVDLVGPNTYNFVENFISSLKMISFPHGLITLCIYCNLNDYSIFDNLEVRTLQLFIVKINCDMLKTLEACDLKCGITLFKCSIENSVETWGLLNKLNQLVSFSIIPEEGTWQSCFEFVSNEVRISNLKEFRFIKNGCIGNFWLALHKYTIDEENMKLEIRDSLTNNLIDLFYNHHNLEFDDKLDYDFYQ